MGKNIGQSIIDTLLKEAFIRIDHEYLPNIALSNPVFIDCVNYIHDNIDAHLSLKDIAMHCNISESYCSNLFVRYLSMNFKDYFTSIKLVNAINLLLSTKHSITTVSELAVLTVIQILQINLRITCILVLNSSVHSFPRLLNHHKYISNKITYHNSLS